MNIEMMTKPFRYCPGCGGAGLAAGRPNSLVCGRCGFEYFFNAAAATAGLIVDAQNRLLVTIRGHEPGKGLPDLPGGFVDAGETAEAALRREIREELNLEVDAMQYFMSMPNEYPYKGIVYPTLDLAYICRIGDLSEMRPQDDIEDVRLMPMDKIDIDAFAFESIRRFVKAFLRAYSA